MKRFFENHEGENNYIISDTSSNYVDCNNDNDTNLKQDLFDSILKSMDTYFKHTQVKSIYDLKVDIRLEDGFLIEEINGDVLNKKVCPIALTKKDEYFFKNTVDYLIEDDLHISSEEIELHINFVH